MLENSSELQNRARLCIGERAVPLLVNGCTRLLIRAATSVSSCSMGPVSYARYAW